MKEIVKSARFHGSHAIATSTPGRTKTILTQLTSGRRDPGTCAERRNDLADAAGPGEGSRSSEASSTGSIATIISLRATMTVSTALADAAEESRIPHGRLEAKGKPAVPHPISLARGDNDIIGAAPYFLFREQAEHRVRVAPHPCTA